ncbi:MAG: diaminopimelate epimerase [Pirellulaceae bacterium]|nr:diaminopimelate epimerase [Pirellulaceae bacterium]
MRFTKMHGAGNDYVYVNCFEETLPEDRLPELARDVSDRHFGIGGDGMILIRPSSVADARMQMFNADGSEAEMCGNGVRCVAKFVHDHGICREKTLRIETGAGVLSLDLDVAGDRVARVRVDMGEPILQPARIPTTLSGDPVVHQPLLVAGQTLEVTCVSMGNPHCVTYVEKLSDHLVLGVGPHVETDPHFPNRVNAEFVEVISPDEVDMRVWERGSGETLACGTGACAVCVAGVLTGRTGRRIVAHLPGGDLELHWSEQDNHVFLTGPAVEVFSGEWRPDEAV